MSRLESPLGRVNGLGSAREGTREFWSIRVTSIVLIPLCLWWIAAIVDHVGAEYTDFIDWVHAPITAILLITTIGVTFYHTAMGLQSVIEDYVHHEGAKLALVIVVKSGCLLITIAGIFSVLRIAFGG